MSESRVSEAAVEFRDALKQVGLDTIREIGEPDERPDLVVVGPQGIRIPIEIQRRSLLTERELPSLLERAKGTPSQATHVVVADRVTERARVELRSRGWGWLDLRGHVHLEAPGVFIDARVTPSARGATESSKESLAGRVGLELATLLLMRPDAALGIRASAAELGRAPSSVSEEMSRLRGAGLVDQDRRPVVPDLFNALAGRWRPDSVDVAALPAPQRLARPPHPGAAHRRSGSRGPAWVGAGWQPGSGRLRCAAPCVRGLPSRSLRPGHGHAEARDAAPRHRPEP